MEFLQEKLYSMLMHLATNYPIMFGSSVAMGTYKMLKSVNDTYIGIKRLYMLDMISTKDGIMKISK